MLRSLVPTEHSCCASPQRPPVAWNCPLCHRLFGKSASHPPDTSTFPQLLCGKSTQAHPHSTVHVPTPPGGWHIHQLSLGASSSAHHSPGYVALHDPPGPWLSAYLTGSSHCFIGKTLAPSWAFQRANKVMSHFPAHTGGLPGVKHVTDIAWQMTSPDLSFPPPPAQGNWAMPLVLLSTAKYLPVPCPYPQEECQKLCACLWGKDELRQCTNAENSVSQSVVCMMGLQWWMASVLF